MWAQSGNNLLGLYISRVRLNTIRTSLVSCSLWFPDFSNQRHVHLPQREPLSLKKAVSSFLFSFKDSGPFFFGLFEKAIETAFRWLSRHCHLKTHEQRVLSRHSQSHQHPARKKLHFPTRLSLINPPGYLTDVLTFDAPSDGVKDGETEDQTQRAEEFIRCRHSKEKKKKKQENPNYFWASWGSTWRGQYGAPQELGDIGSFLSETQNAVLTLCCLSKLPVDNP